MKQAVDILQVATNGQGFVDITASLVDWTRRQEIARGLLTVMMRHTSASLVIQENADPDVRVDLEAFFKRLVPVDKRAYLHSCEGPDDMPSHIRAALTQTHLGIPIMDGRLALGTWQAVYLYEHRDLPHQRTLALHLIGE
ncbi:MAG: secondary thiamine-phosphate synthase enzyme YjbQ [Myxococcota bacterium]|jgi:secondary thiamine-phosphate synthase enzyme|nr:secondary thiamine-phosphate synthase enzyme YjbQ [Myxococcota bacterium]